MPAQFARGQNAGQIRVSRAFCPQPRPMPRNEAPQGVVLRRRSSLACPTGVCQQFPGFGGSVRAWAPVWKRSSNSGTSSGCERRRARRAPAPTRQSQLSGNPLEVDRDLRRLVQHDDVLDFHHLEPARQNPNIDHRRRASDNDAVPTQVFALQSARHRHHASRIVQFAGDDQVNFSIANRRNAKQPTGALRQFLALTHQPERPAQHIQQALMAEAEALPQLRRNREPAAAIRAKAAMLLAHFIPRNIDNVRLAACAAERIIAERQLDQPIRQNQRVSAQILDQRRHAQIGARRGLEQIRVRARIHRPGPATARCGAISPHDLR